MKYLVTYYIDDGGFSNIYDSKEELEKFLSGDDYHSIDKIIRGELMDYTLTAEVI